VEEVAALLKFSNRQSVYKLRREGQLHAVNLGGDDGKTLRFRRSEVRRFIAEHLEQNGANSGGSD
jgi:excisionase family DNA binding protein